MPITDKREYKINPLNLNSEGNSNESLLVFENELSLENQKLKNYKNVYLVLLSNEARKIKLEQNVLNYKSQVITDQKKRFDHLQLIDEIKLKNLTEKIKFFDVIHPCIGDNYSYLNSLRKNKI